MFPRGCSRWVGASVDWVHSVPVKLLQPAHPAVTTLHWTLKTKFHPLSSTHVLSSQTSETFMPYTSTVWFEINPSFLFLYLGRFIWFAIAFSHSNLDICCLHSDPKEGRTAPRCYSARSQQRLGPPCALTLKLKYQSLWATLIYHRKRKKPQHFKLFGSI